MREELSGLDSVISGVTKAIDGQISSINSQKDAALEAIDAQKDALEDAKDAAVEALEAERDARLKAIEAQKEQLEGQIGLIDKQIESKQDEIDAINEAADARKRETDLQKAQYELERIQSQRAILQYSEDKGIHYAQDTNGIRDAKEQVDDAKREIGIAAIEKEVSLLEDQKSLLNEQIGLLDERADKINSFYDEEIEKTEAFYDAQIKALEGQREQTEQYFGSVIRNLESSKSRYEELTGLLDKAELSAKLRQLGIDEEALLNGSEEEFQKLKDAYLGIVFQLNEGNDAVLGRLYELSGYDGAAPSLLSDTAERLDEMNGKLGTSYQGIGNVNSLLSNTSAQANGMAGNITEMLTGLKEVDSIIAIEQAALATLKQTIGEVITAISDKTNAIWAEQAATGIATSLEIISFLLLKAKISEVLESIISISNAMAGLGLGIVPIIELTMAFLALHNSIQLVSTALGADKRSQDENHVSSIAAAIQSLNEISLEEGIIAQFYNLKDAIGAVAQAIGGGGSGGSGESDATGGQALTGKRKIGRPAVKGSPGSSSGSSLADAISSFGDTAKEAIGEAGAEGDGTVIGRFGSLEAAVDGVSAAIGSGATDSDGKQQKSLDDESDGSLIDSIHTLGDDTAEILGEPGGKGLIGKFEQFKEPIREADEHVQSINGGLKDIDGKNVECTITINVEMNGSLSGTTGAGKNATNEIYTPVITGKAGAQGTALVSGNWAAQSSEGPVLVGELGYEIVVRNGRFFTVGNYGAEMFPIKRWDIVFNHEQSRQLLKHGRISGRGKAYADGTVGGGKSLSPDGQVLMPIGPGDRAWELQKAFEPLIAKIDGNVGYLAGNALIAHDKQMQEMINHLNTNNIVTNNMPSITIGDINITCPGITSRDVARQVGAEINHLFSGLHLDALQLSMMR